MTEISTKQIMEASDEDIKKALDEPIPEEEKIEPQKEDDSEPKKEEDVKPKDPNPDDFVFNRDAYKDKSADDLLSELEKSQKQVFHKEKFINRQKDEVGKTRKEMSEMVANKKKLEDRLAELEKSEKDVYSDPNAYADNKVEQKEIKQEIDKINKKESSFEFENQARAIYPDFDSLMANEVPEIITNHLKANGQESEIQSSINWFQSGEWKNAGEQERNIALSIFQKANHLKDLKAKDAEIERLRNQKNDSAEQVAKNIRDVAKQATVGTAGASTKTKEFTAKELADMSDEAFAAISENFK